MKKVSVILADWSVRESFHAVDYLNKQTIPRSDYETIWVEYYDHRPKPIQDHVDQGNIDKWIVLNKIGIYFKHMLYNEGMAASTGEIVVICDSDGIFSPNFVESIVTTFEKHEDIILYIEEVRSNNRSFYPFRYLPWENIWKTVMEKPGVINWDKVAKKPSGLTTNHDMIHHRNYGACFCATRKSVIEVGGCDEHLSYHCFLCGPYELGWRLINKGYREIWHQSEWMLHVWHPWVRSGTDIMGESDGRGLNSMALEIRKTRRVAPLVENENIMKLRTDGKVDSLKEDDIQRLDTISIKSVENKNIKFRYNLHRFKVLMKYLFKTSVKVKKVLILKESEYKCEYEDLVYRTIDLAGLVSKIEVLDYDILYHNFGKNKMLEKLIKECEKLKPDLVIFVPITNTDDLSSVENVEPSKDVINRIMNDLGIKVYAHIFDSTKCSRLYGFFHFFNFIGIMDSLSEYDKYADNPKTISGYPEINPINFYDKKMKRDLDVCFWGSVPLNSKREKYIKFLRNNGISVYTREYRVSDTKYSDILNRSKISLSFGHERDKKNKLRKRSFEIMACKSLLLEEDGTSETEKLFNVNEDFVSFRNKEELLNKIEYYLKNYDHIKLIAQSGYDRVTNNYNNRNMWENVFKNIGFDDKNGGIYLKIAYFCSESLERIIKDTIRKILPLEFRTSIKSIASRLHIINMEE